MAVTRIKTSGVYGQKSDSALVGLPGVMPAPTAADAATGGAVNVSFTAITGATSYGVISSPGNITATGTTSPISVTGLTNETSYTFQIRAINAQGTGAYSAASNSATPTGFNFESIATANTNGNSSVTFSSFPSTYRHLQIRYAVDPNAGDGITLGMRFNSDSTSAYTRHYMYTSNTSAAGGTYTNSTYLDVSSFRWGMTNAYSGQMIGIIDIPNYRDSILKMARVISGQNGNNSSAQEISLLGGTWNNTAAITDITLFLSSNVFSSTSSVALYGII